MTQIDIRQIYYSEATRAELDPGFTPLDNLDNPRPDWREYWPIRRFLLGNSLEPDTYYGFFSPKFAAKTGLNSTAVRDLIERQGADADVIAFPPSFNHMAMFLNIMEQAVICHGNADALRQCAELLAPRFQMDRSVMTSLDTIFCNFFVARPEFWQEWLRQGERLFEIAERGTSPLAQALNQVVPYFVPMSATRKDGSGSELVHHEVPGVPLKVFAIERLVSLVLWSQPRWTVKSFNPSLLRPASDMSPDCLVLDALKMAYGRTGAEAFLEVFHKLRPAIIARNLPIANGAHGTPVQARPATQPPGPKPALAKIRVVCATRRTSRGEFDTQTALGQSLSLRLPPQVELRLFPANGAGLSHVYNIAIEESRDDPAMLLFVHDDVRLCDLFWADRLRDGLNAFDVIGIVGNRRRVPRQPSWAFSAVDFVSDRLTVDDRQNFSGAFCHGEGAAPEGIDAFGPSGQSVKLLDGLFLAARSDTLWEKSVRFDERFEFHFYDLDFCRQAERAGLSLGTWPISVIHASKGHFAGKRWRQAYERYIEKWGD